VKSNIPYQNWFNNFKAYLIVNAGKEQIKALYMWWNGWVFSFEKTPKLSTIDDGESSGMDEAINCLDSDNDFGMQVSTDRQESGSQLEEYLMDTFDSLAIMAEHHHQLGLGESSSGSSRVPPNQPAQPIVSSFAPVNGPSHMDSVEQQLEDTMIPEISQAMEEEIVSQNSGKGKGKSKEKAVDNITKVDMQVKKAGGKQRGRPKKMAN
jgi:hypothetical protein